jgi:hypothetical protein
VEDLVVRFLGSFPAPDKGHLLQTVCELYTKVSMLPQDTVYILFQLRLTEYEVTEKKKALKNKYN